MGWYREVLHISFAYVDLLCVYTLHVFPVLFSSFISQHTNQYHPKIWKQFQRRKVNDTAKLLAHYHGASMQHQVSRMGLGRLLLG